MSGPREASASLKGVSAQAIEVLAPGQVTGLFREPVCLGLGERQQVSKGDWAGNLRSGPDSLDPDRGLGRGRAALRSWNSLSSKPGRGRWAESVRAIG